MTEDPHKDCALQYAGAPIEAARRVVVALHGRYGKPADILKHAEAVDVGGVAWVAPQAAGKSWWGESFLAPLCMNAPGLGSALRRLTMITDFVQEQGFGPHQIVLAGFSQGACLALEHVARHPCAWGGVVAMSGGLLGVGEGDGAPREALNGYAPKTFEYAGDLTGLPIHMGCHRDDPVIPIARVKHSAEILRGMGAKVNLEIAAGKMHGVLKQDIAALRALLRA